MTARLMRRSAAFNPFLPLGILLWQHACPEIE
jgi:hypothetical protein